LQLTHARIDLVSVGVPPTISTIALEGDPTIVPVPAVNRTAKYFVLVEGLEFKIGIVIVLFEASPLAQVNVPVSEVNCLPARAVSATVL
jgi:hypothetical protein